MTLIARIEGGVVAEYRDDIDLASIPEHKRQYFLPVVDTKPTINPKLKVLTGPVVTVGANQVDRVWTAQQRSQEEIRAAVNAERDRRIDAGFSVDFGGGVIKPFDSTQDARDNIAGVHSFALAAIVGGAQQGNLRWANPDADFEWICADNSRVTMDAFTAREFAEVAMEYKSAIIFAARVVKDMGTIPENYADDQYWPGSTLTLG